MQHRFDSLLIPFLIRAILFWSKTNPNSANIRRNTTQQESERKKKRKAIVIVSLICSPTYLSKSNKILKRFDFSSSRLQNNGLRSRVTEEAEKSVEKHESCFPPRGPSPRGRVDLTEQTRRIGADLFPSRGQRERGRRASRGEERRRNRVIGFLEPWTCAIGGWSRCCPCNSVPWTPGPV